MSRCNRSKCQAQAVEGRKFCQYHLDLFKKNAAIKRKKRKEKSCCHACGKPKQQLDKVRCNDCLKLSKIDFKKRFEKNKIEGKCVICGLIKNNKRASMCDACALKDISRQKDNRLYCKKNKLCYKCYVSLENGKVLCLNCSLENNIRKNIIYVLRKKQIPKKSRTEEIIGCTVEQFRDYIKNAMEPWMNEDNYGVHVPGERRWQLGHKMPIAAFDLANPEQLKKAWHYTNIVPQEAEENIAFGDIMFVDGKIVRGRYLK
jgi:hypothetical protein